MVAPNKKGDKVIVYCGIQRMEATVVDFHTRHAGLDFYYLSLDTRPDQGYISRSTLDIFPRG